MSQTLDMLLAQPLPEISDNGFSNRVMAEMAVRQLRRDRFNTEIAIGLVVFAVLVLPFTGAGQILAAAAATGSGMVLISLMFGAILTLAALKTARR